MIQVNWGGANSPIRARMSTMLRPELLARYGSRNIPRYTSYPTAPHFRAVEDDGLVREWLGRVPAKEAVSLYVHVPFCQAMCWYCGCHTSVSRRAAPVSRYLQRVQEEIGMVAELLPARMAARHLHFGGGTPTLMQPEEFEALTGKLRSAFDFAPDAEIAIEVDPRTLGAPMADALGRSGVNRASIGVQSFDPKVQQAINRVQSLSDTAEAVERLRSAGIAGINLDLLYGLPFQDEASCRATVEQALSLSPDRLSVFGYAHVPSFKPHQRKIPADALPGSGERMAQFDAITGALKAAGYVQVGLDHFARPDDALAVAAGTGRLHRNFQGYTTDECRTLLGFGASSIGRLPGGFVQNAVAIPDYERRIAGGRLATARVCPISEEDQRRGALIERLMCDHAVDLAGVEDLVDERKLAPFLADGLVRRRGARLEVPVEARPLVRAVAAAFDTYLEEGADRHARAV
jgi:oxygen-independent coproporphyrinogen-3 oxidase